jgi:hypothetical protein
MRFSLQSALVLAVSVVTIDAQAHGGGLNADGCHVNRKSGDYHCHRASAKAPDAFGAYGSAQNLMPPNSGLRGDTRRTGSFANCAQARAAGAAPVRIGEPGYAAHLDRDGDGVGCEPYRGRR